MQAAAAKTCDDAEKAMSIIQKAFHKQIHSEMDVIEMSRKGVTKAALVMVGQCFDLSLDTLARMLPVTLRTVQRYSRSQKFNPTVSEHIIQLARLMAKGVEVFESRDKFKRWFTTPNVALGGKAPSELVSLKTGTQLVMDELMRIDYGVFA